MTGRSNSLLRFPRIARAALQPTLRLVEHGQSAARGGSAGEVRGVNVHAGTAIDGRDRKRLERLCR